MNHDLLTSVRAGKAVTVTGFVEGDEHAVRKILALGIIPGDRIDVLATNPAFLIEIGSAQYAIDSELALARQPFAVAKDSRHAHTLNRLLDAIGKPDAQQRFTQLGFVWVK